MFVEATDVDQALRHYALAFGIGLEEQCEELLQALHGEDFLCEAMLETTDLIEVGTDLDGTMMDTFDPDTGEGVTAWIVGRSGDPDCLLDSLPSDGNALRIWYGVKPVEISFAPRWDDDAFGLLFIRAGG